MVNLALTNPALETAIRADRTDPGPCEVYADWLQEHGSPLGELIMLEHALATRSDARALARSRQLLAALQLHEHGVYDVTWRCGLWSRLAIARPTMPPQSFEDRRAQRRCEAPRRIDPQRVAQLFAMPLCAALDELHLGSLHDHHNADLIPRVLADAGTHGWATELPRLVLADSRMDLGFGAYTAGRVGQVIGAAFPGLRGLSISTGECQQEAEKFSLEGLVLPELRELAVSVFRCSGWLRVQVYAVSAPRLERLELSLNNDTNPQDFDPLLERRCFPALRRLGLHATSCGDELLARLPGSPLAAQLEALDLSSLLITTRPVRELARHVRAFPRLRTLEIGKNYISKQAVETLRAAFAPCTVLSERQYSPQSLAQSRRYDALGE